MAKYTYTQRTPGHIQVTKGSKKTPEITDVVMVYNHDYDLPEDHEGVQYHVSQGYLVKVEDTKKPTPPDPPVV